MKFLIYVTLMGFLQQRYVASSSSSEEDVEEITSAAKTTKTITKSTTNVPLVPTSGPTVGTTANETTKTTTTTTTTKSSTNEPSTPTSPPTFPGSATTKTTTKSTTKVPLSMSKPTSTINSRSTTFPNSATTSKVKNGKKDHGSSSEHSSEENRLTAIKNDAKQDPGDANISEKTREQRENQEEEEDKMTALFIGVIVAIVLLILLLLVTLLFKCYRYKTDKKDDAYATILQPTSQSHEVHHHYNYPTNPAFTTYIEPQPSNTNNTRTEPMKSSKDEAYVNTGSDHHLRNKPTESNDNEININRAPSSVDSGYEQWLPDRNSQQESNPSYLEVISD